MKWNLTPAEPTPEMYEAAQGYIDCGGQKSDVVYRAMLSATPDPLEDAELVERVARWLAFHNGYVHEVYYTNFMTAAKDLIKTMQEGKK